MKLDASLTCPSCGLVAVETMPTAYCVCLYVCAGCQSVVRPKAGDCCVFCSYADTPCPPIQAERATALHEAE